MNWFAASLVLLCCTACSGKSTSDAGHPDATGGSSAGGTSGTSGAGGAGNAGGTTSSGGAGLGGNAGAASTTCPSARPTAGTACNYVGNQCNYAIDECVSIGLSCTLGVWTEVPNNDGASLTCINFTGANLPKDGDSCACRGLLDCSIDDCTRTGKVHAVCDNTTWHVTSEPCADTPCGSAGLSCKQGEVCVVPGGLGDTPKCKPDPCAEQSETTSCQCAAALCGSQQCSVLNGVVECICLAC